MEAQLSTAHPLLRGPSTTKVGHPRLRRLRARLSSWRLDHELARGVDPYADALLDCRTQQLTSADERQRIAAGLRDAVADAIADKWPSCAAPLASSAIRANCQLALTLAERLESERPIAPAGAARARLLL